MGVQGVGGGNPNFIERLATEVEQLTTEARDLVEDLSEAIVAQADKDSAIGLLRQQGDQNRGRLEAFLDFINPFDDASDNVQAIAPNATVKAPRNDSPVAKQQFATEELRNTGAVYRKVTTEPRADTFGLRSDNGTIPHVSIDPKRFNFPKTADGKQDRSFAAFNDPGLAGSQTVSRDTPSIYMGGRGGIGAKGGEAVEIDAGLAWKRTFTADKKAVWTTAPNGSSRTDQYTMSQSKDQSGKTIYTVKDLKGNAVAQGDEFKPKDDGSVDIGGKTFRPNFAFRPFFRSSDAPTAKQGNSGYDQDYARAGTATDREFYAGDKFTMSMTVDPANPDRTTFGVRGVTKDGEQIAASTHSKTIANFGDGSREFKRVDSIDQKGREGVNGDKYVYKEVKGKRVLDKIIKGGGSYEGTGTTVSGGSWGATSVMKKDGTSTPLTGANGTAQRSVEFKKDYNQVFGIGGERTTREDGSEAIYINPPDKR